MELFLYAMRSDATKDRYTKRLRNFFDFLEYPGDLSEQAKQFIANSQKNGNTWVTANVMKFLSFHKERVERGEIAEGTLRNYYKPVKLFLEMNDIELYWRKITRGLPRGRKHAADRAPTVAEIQKLIEYPDRRIKAIIFTMLSSGIRLGAWDYLRWSHITPIIQDDKIVAAKIIVYAGDAGNDRMSGGPDNDEIHGGDGDDQLTGRDGNDILFGDGDNDILSGGAGNDTMDGGSGDDNVLGRTGDDSMFGGIGDDVCIGGSGIDTADIACEIAVT